MGKMNNQGNGGGGNFKQDRRQQEPQTFEHLAQAVQTECFSTNSAELLKMSTTQNLDAILKSIEGFVLKYGEKVSTSQLRNVYDKSTKAKSVNELKLIRPQLAYIAGRAQQDKENVKKFLAFIDSLIKQVSTEEQRKEFKTFFESVVAYHKFNSTTN